MTLSNSAQYISGRTVQEQMNSLIDYVDQRAADVALDAIASDVAQVHQDMLDADADASAAAASAAAAAGTLANAVKKAGEASQSIAGDITVAGDLSAGGDASVTGDAGVQGQLSVLGGCDLRAPVKIPVTPTNNDDAASKKYVDDSLDNYAPMIRTTGSQVAAGNKHMNTVTYIGSAASSGDAGYSLIADLGPIGSACFAFIAVSRGGALMGAVSVDSSGIPTYSGAGISGSTTFGIALKDGNMYIAMKRTGASGQSYTINIYGVTKGTSHYTIQPYDGNAPVETVDSYTEACKI